MHLVSIVISELIGKPQTLKVW